MWWLVRTTPRDDDSQQIDSQWASGPSQASTNNDARLTAYPSLYKEEQYEQFRCKNERLYAHNEKLGCTLCHDVKYVGLIASYSVNIVIQRAGGKITQR